MSHSVTVELSDTTYATLQLRAQAAAKSPAAVAAAALEKQFGIAGANSSPLNGTPAELQAARERFERHFGAINLGNPTGADNESIDADLAREYANRPEGG